eukprot:TRINITY_DN71270_c0_g1_i1.p1 TRINITY_DN71270_c0_g1~~TRINITY_DN71270_c0_g1_i1.p1  ORF type:complete len:314 (+),score=36.36 TRINITY_DN71270_c0_g1_i1:122-1063(+)
MLRLPVGHLEPPVLQQHAEGAVPALPAELVSQLSRSAAALRGMSKAAAEFTAASPGSARHFAEASAVAGSVGGGVGGYGPNVARARGVRRAAANGALPSPPLPPLLVPGPGGNDFVLSPPQMPALNPPVASNGPRHPRFPRRVDAATTNVFGKPLQHCGYADSNHPGGNVCYGEVCARVNPDFFKEVSSGPLAQIRDKRCITAEQLGDWARGAHAHRGIEGVDCAATSAYATQRRGDGAAQEFLFSVCPKMNAADLPGWMVHPLPPKSPLWPNMCSDPVEVFSKVFKYDELIQPSFNRPINRREDWDKLTQKL